MGAFRANSFAFRAYFPAFPICNPESLECFPDTFVGFPALPCVFWFLCFFWWKNVLSINKDGRVALSHWEKFFKMKCKKLKRLPVPNPWPNFEFFHIFVFENSAKRVQIISLKTTSFLPTRAPNHGLKRTEKNKKKAVAKGRHTADFFWEPVS